MKYRYVCFTALLLGCIALKGQTTVTVHNTETDKDYTVEMPSGMTIDADDLMQNWQAARYLTEKTDCRQSDINPQFTKEEYADRLRRLPTVIPMTYNDCVGAFIDQYTGKLRKQLSYILGASNFYVPIFEEALDAYELPLELKYLPMVESALDPTLQTDKGCGLWQFSIRTARKYGLVRNSLVDERRDAYKASFAAAKYLDELYKKYSDWYLAIAAFNCGPTNVDKAIRRADGMKDYWTIAANLPSDARGYVPAFIAANYVMNYYCEHNICPMDAALPEKADTVTVSRDVRIGQIAGVCHVSAEAVKALNPQYRTALIPGGKHPCPLCLPQQALTAFIDAQDSVYTYQEPKDSLDVSSKLTNSRHRNNVTSDSNTAATAQQPVGGNDEANDSEQENVGQTSHRSRSVSRRSRRSRKSSRKSRKSSRKSRKSSRKSKKSSHKSKKSSHKSRRHRR